MMRRREVITLLGGAAAAWPFGARAQAPGKLPTIGVLAQLPPTEAVKLELDRIARRERDRRRIALPVR